MPTIKSCVAWICPRSYSVDDDMEAEWSFEERDIRIFGREQKHATCSTKMPDNAPFDICFSFPPGLKGASLASRSDRGQQEKRWTGFRVEISVNNEANKSRTLYYVRYWLDDGTALCFNKFRHYTWNSGKVFHVMLKLIPVTSSLHSDRSEQSVWASFEWNIRVGSHIMCDYIIKNLPHGLRLDDPTRTGTPAYRCARGTLKPGQTRSATSNKANRKPWASSADQFFDRNKKQDAGWPAHHQDRRRRRQDSKSSEQTRSSENRNNSALSPAISVLNLSQPERRLKRSASESLTDDDLRAKIQRPRNETESSAKKEQVPPERHREKHQEPAWRSSFTQEKRHERSDRKERSTRESPSSDRAHRKRNDHDNNRSSVDPRYDDRRPGRSDRDDRDRDGYDRHKDRRRERTYHRSRSPVACPRDNVHIERRNRYRNPSVDQSKPVEKSPTQSEGDVRMGSKELSPKAIELVIPQGPVGLSAALTAGEPIDIQEEIEKLKVLDRLRAVASNYDADPAPREEDHARRKFEEPPRDQGWGIRAPQVEQKPPPPPPRAATRDLRLKDRPQINSFDGPRQDANGNSASSRYTLPSCYEQTQDQQCNTQQGAPAYVTLYPKMQPCGSDVGFEQPGEGRHHAQEPTTYDMLSPTGMQVDLRPLNDTSAEPRVQIKQESGSSEIHELEEGECGQPGIKVEVEVESLRRQLFQRFEELSASRFGRTAKQKEVKVDMQD